jgi:uncharacterized membrane protein
MSTDHCCCNHHYVQVGAVMADVVFAYVDQRTSFFLSAAFSLLGCCTAWLFVPDTTGMSLDELDR